MKEKAVKVRKRGECLYWQKRNLTRVTWHDRKTVSVLATLPTSTMDSSTVQHLSKRKWEGGEEAIF